MDILTKLPVADWMAAPETLAVFDALSAAGGTGRFVGGCVRSHVRGDPVRDIDIATDLRPEDSLKALEGAGIKVIPTGLKHGTVTAVSGGLHHEITTLRHDVETDGRHAEVAYTDDWVADAERRDFTMNAMYLGPDGALFDPMCGFEDAKAGRVRFVGDARTRITEDYLRILRFFRFRAHYGSGKPDGEALAACRELASGMDRLSGERIQADLLRLLEASDPKPTLQLMSDNNILEHLAPGLEFTSDLARLVSLEGDKADPVRRLALLAADNAWTISKHLRMSRADSDRIASLSGPAPNLSTRRDQKAGLYRLGRDRFVDAVLFAGARDDLSVDDTASALSFADQWTIPSFPIAGRDLLDAGCHPGRHIGDALKMVEAWWIAENFGPDKQACLSHALDLVGEAQFN